MSLRLPKMSQLIAFEAVARSMSINAAAKKLGKPQSTLSRSIKELEETTGVQLFTRGGTGVVLTPAGQCFFNYASSVVREMHQAMEETAAVAGRSAHTISIAVPPILTRSILNAGMMRLINGTAQCKLNVEVAAFSTSLPRLNLGLLDFAIGTPCDELLLGNYVVEPLMKCPIAIACALDHPLRKAKTLDELKHARWLFTPEFELFKKEFPQAAKIEPAHSLTSSGYFLTNQMLACNGFLAMLSSVHIRRHRDFMDIIPVDGFPHWLEYVLVYPKDRPRSSLTERFIDYLHQEADDFEWDSFKETTARKPFI
ncbi:MAG TPA: LysR family transcriptional regulator [Candidatus Aphodousia gallistercoris]|nr:LysR family transcriptional regulator [Candidatus Aphodousia gallistercoris]